MTCMSQHGKSVQVTLKVIKTDVQSNELRCAAVQTKLNTSKTKTSIITV